MSDVSPTIHNGMIVSIHYKLTNDTDQILDDSDGRPPMAYLHGANNIVEGLENALAGKSVGDHVQVSVPPEQGYGLRNNISPRSINRTELPDEITLRVGMQFGIADEDNAPVPVWVSAVTDEHAILDFNHPLAGQTLHFDVSIAEIRAASSEELEYGRPISASSCCSASNDGKGCC